jgi:hypothetical protein
LVKLDYKETGMNGPKLPGELVHGDMHSRETRNGTDRNGDEKPLPELEERQPASDASAGDVYDEMVQEGRDRVVTVAAPFVVATLGEATNEA